MRRLTILTLCLALILPALTLAAPFGSLIKLACTTGADLSDPCRSVYYLGQDSKRYVFPNQKTYDTWYADFSDIQIVSQSELSSYPIGGNVTYRPGAKLVKITTDPKVYAVAEDATLRWVTTAAIAESIFGTAWSSLVEDIPDAFFVNYKLGSQIEAAGTYNRQTLLSTYQRYDQVLGNTQNEEDQPPSSTGTLSDFTVDDITTATAQISWTSSIPTQSTVHIGTTSSANDFSFSETGFSTIHVANVTDLLPGVTYYYRITSVTQDQAQLNSTVNSFITKTPFATGGVTIANWETFSLTPPTADVMAPVVTNMGNVFGLAWLGRADSGSDYQIYFTRVNQAGQQSSDWTSLHSERPINEIALASNGSNEFFVAWTEEADPVTGMTALYSATLNSEGDLVSGPDKFLEREFAAAPTGLSAGFNGTNYGVVYSGQETGQPYSNIFFALVSPTGELLQDLFQVTDRSENSTQPALTWSGSSFGLVWRTQTEVESNVYFLPLDSFGHRSLIPTEKAIVVSDNQFPGQPSIDALSATEFAIAWFDFNSGSGFARQDIYWKTMRDTGVEVYAPLRLTEYDQSFDGQDPLVVATGDKSHVIWHRDGEAVFLTSIAGASDILRQRQQLFSGSQIDNLVGAVSGSVAFAAWEANGGIRFTIGQ